MRESSANRWNWLSGWLIKHRKCRGPEIVPCAIPDLTSTLVDRWPSQQMIYVHSLRKALIHRKMFPSIPKSLSLLMNHVWGTLLNALEKFKIATSVCDLARSHFSSRSWMVSRSCVSHECLARNPGFRVVRALWRSRWSKIWEHSICTSATCQEYKWW